MKGSIFLEYLMVVALVLYLFMGVNLILAKTPKRDLYTPYRNSKLLVGIAFLLVALMLGGLWLARAARWAESAILAIDLVSHYAVYILLTVASINLFKHDYLNRASVRRLAMGFAAITAISALSLLITPNSQWTVQAAGTAWLFGYMIWFIAYFHKIIRQVRAKMVNYHNRALTHYIRWVIRSVMLWVVFGLASTFVPFAPTWVQIAFRIYGIAVNCYIYASFRNYLMHYEAVELAIREMERRHYNKHRPPKSQAEETRDQMIEQGIQVWLRMNGFTQTGVTVEQLALQIGTNRSYLSYYINRTYGTKFSDWLNQLRLKHAKNMLRADKSLSMEEVAMRSGFSSGSYFTKIFVKSTGKPPMKWREQNTRPHTGGGKQE